MLVTPVQRHEADPTSGMTREEAISVEGMWAGLVRTEAHAASGWHHHGAYDTAIFVVDGDVRLEFGPDGRQAIEAGPGDFVHVPKGAIHRESNPSEHESHIVVVRAGSGPATVNVAGPPSSTH
ncbi:MAG: cupin domain-containing protein [Acidimicrobiales bacterium]